MSRETIKPNETIILLIVVLTLIIIPFSLPQKHKYSSELIAQKTELENQIRTDFIDSTGKITYAEDKGYASVLKTYENKHVILEQYFDEKGKAVNLSEGYSIIRREYEDGLNTVVSFLDKEEKPVVITGGYDSVHHSYYQSGEIDTDTFYIDGVQAERNSGYWQIKRVYQDGKLIETRFLDQEGNLSPDTTFGYAVVRRYDTEKGREEYYFDAEEKATSASLGQYGVRIEDGTTTYLDAEGNVLNTRKGYAIIRQEGNKTLYYDKYGLPVTIGRNQYGTEIVNGQIIYLDKNGARMFRFDNWLNTHPYFVIAVALILSIAAAMLKGRVKAAFTIVYILGIIYMTMWHRESGDSRGEFTFFWSYRQLFSNSILGRDLINNIWLFVPLGAALYDPNHRLHWLICIVLSICIETVQYFTGIGLAEFDDVISNGVGALIGYSAAKNICFWRKELLRRRSIKYKYKN